jgi:NAD(P)-dependent dehydrogenase (short-subunit alcohol dehydrogenase family)
VSRRLEGKTAIVSGAGQTPGETMGNGRAIALRFAEEGADVLCVDRDAARAEETAAMILAAGGPAAAFAGRGSTSSSTMSASAVAATVPPTLPRNAPGIASSPSTSRRAG